MKWLVALSAFLGFVSVIIGAAGDHMFADQVTPETAHVFETALRYHQLYAVLTLCLSLWTPQGEGSKVFAGALCAFLSGTAIFCGSLYASIFLDMPALTMLTPVGGLTIMGGWGAIFLFAIRMKR
jgi:uncharacterized membrane protein YgdD (TMEM256/DUF423 family)